MKNNDKFGSEIRPYCKHCTALFRCKLQILLLFWAVFFQIPDLSGQSNNNDPSNAKLEEARSYLVEADAWLFENSDSAYHYGIMALQSAQKLNVDSLIAKSHRIIGISHYFNGNFYLMAEHCELGLETEYAANNRMFASSLWNNMGIAYDMLTDYDKSIFAYNKSMELEQLLNNDHGYHVTLINLGLLHAKANNPMRGIEVLEQALDYFKTQDDTLHIGLSFQNLGKIYHDKKNLEIYEKYALKSLEMFAAIKDSVRIADVYYNLSLVAASQGDNDNWEKYILLSRDIQPPNLYKETNIMLQLGGLAVHKGNYDEAEKLLYQAMENYRTLGAKKNLQYVYRQLLQLYAHKGDLEKHSQTLNEFGDYMEESLNEAMLNRFAELDYTYETTRTKQQLQQYEYFNEQQTKTITLLISMLVISLLLVLLFAGLAYRFRNNPK